MWCPKLRVSYSLLLQYFVTLTCSVYLSVICRYSAVRRQFGPEDGGDEHPVLEYQLQQWRILPLLCGAVIMDHYALALNRDFIMFHMGTLFGERGPQQAQQGVELHIVSCAAKCFASWLARDAIQVFDCSERENEVNVNKVFP